MLNRFRKSYVARLPLWFAAAQLTMSLGCATIRKFNPIESNTLEARRLTQQAEAAIHQSLWDEAESKLVHAIERCPEDNRAREVLADVLWQRGAQKAAVEQKQRSIELSGRRDPYALTELGQMELSVGNLSQALSHADEAISHDSSLADAWALRGFVLRLQGQHAEALSAFLRSLSIRNEDPRTRLEIAKIYRETGQQRRAIAILGSASKEAVAACPYFPEVCYLRGQLLRDLNRPTDAVAALQSAREHGCNAPDLPLMLAEAQLACGERMQARATLATALSDSVAGTSTNPKIRIALEELSRKLGADAVNSGATAESVAELQPSDIANGESAMR